MANEKKTKIHMLRPTFIAGNFIEADKQVLVDVSLAKELVGMGKACAPDDAPKKKAGAKPDDKTDDNT